MTLQHQTLPETAAKAVLDIIIEDGLDEGDPLPSSTDLAERFNVSAVVIREALAILSARGVVSRRQGREAIVAKPGHEILTELWRLRVHHDDLEVDEFLQCRVALELQTAALAARNADAGRLHQLASRMSLARSTDEFNEIDYEFHLELARLSGNRVMEVVLASLQSVMHEVFTYGLDQVAARSGSALPDVAQLHVSIADCVDSGDSDAAAAAMAAHFRYSVPGLFITQPTTFRSDG